MPLLVGPAALIQAIATKLNYPCPPIHHGDLATASEPCLIDTGGESLNQVRPGKFDALTGQASFDAVCLCVDAAIRGDVAAVVTGPIQKEAWKLAGIQYPGHTEFLAERTGTDDVRMMLTSDQISCVLVTIHVPLADVPRLLTQQAIVDSIRLAGEAAWRRIGRQPRITVCGLNPHAGENGMFSHGEETNIIEPAIAESRQHGFDVRGPLPPDTAFTPLMREATDVYVCMYHDQGLIPLKALAFDDAVNVTLGLPIIRTSVDHGTALDLAWTGKASHGSFLAAIELAIDLAAPTGTIAP